jgi:hypothetical protein
MDALWVGAVVLVADILMNIWRLLASRCSSSVRRVSAKDSPAIGLRYNN